jgi:AcrR family transcriptional regulator
MPMQERIVQAAIEEIQSKGLKFTMADLARRAGISTKTLYGHFPSKEELIRHLIEQGNREVRDSMEAIVNRQDLDVTEKLRRLLAYVPSGFGGTDLRLWYELKRYYPAQWALVDKCFQEEWDQVRAVLEEGMRQGVFRRVNADILIQMYVGAWEQMINRQASSRDRMTIHEALDAVIDILLGGVVSARKRQEESV